jgi:hypothetical protein
MCLYSIVMMLMGITMGFAQDNARDTEDRLARSFNEYANSWRDKDIGKVWEMMSPHARSGNAKSGNDSAGKFEEFVKSNGFYPSEFKQENIRMNGSEAFVTAKVTYRDFSGKDLGSQIEEIKFVSVDGKWLFDSYRQK